MTRFCNSTNIKISVHLLLSRTSILIRVLYLQDIIHCHDWSSAPVAWLFKDHYMQYGLSNAKVVFTIHNLEFGAHFIERAMAYSHKATTVGFWSLLNLLKAHDFACSNHVFEYTGISHVLKGGFWKSSDCPSSSQVPRDNKWN